MSSNPLIQNTGLTPDFAAIRPEHFEPAFEAAIKEIRQKISLMKERNDEPTFENTAETLEALFLELDRLHYIYEAFANNRSSKAIEDLNESLSLKREIIEKEVFQDKTLAHRFKAVYDARDTLNLNEEQQRVLENLYRSFEYSASFLSPADQQALNRIDQALITHCDTFSKNHTAGAIQQAFLAEEEELAGVPEDARSSMQDHVRKALAGLKVDASEEDREFKDRLPEAVIDRLSEMAVTGTLSQAYLFLPERLLVDDLLACAADSGFRKKIFTALNNIGTQAPYDSEEALRNIQRLRQERTALLNNGRAAGTHYRHYADYVLSKTMAGSLATVDEFFARMEKPLLAKFEQDLQTLKTFAASKGERSPLMPWDVPYWTARYKKETWNFDIEKMSEYFEVETVTQGFLEHAAKLFGLTFSASAAHPKIHDDAETYDVRDAKTGAFIGILHMDLYARPGKRGGAWVNTFQEGDGDLPMMAAMNCNLAKPGEGKPALMSVGQVETFFHEGGHALNQLLGAGSKYVTLHGTAHPMDFVENHSMAQERWSTSREVMGTYARHHQTGASLPEALIRAMENSGAFMQARDPLLLIQNSRRDFLFHSMNPADYKNAADTHRKARLASGAADHIRPYALTRFTHLFDAPVSAYAAGYYSYLWADACAADIFSFFKASGLYDPERSAALRQFYADGAARKPGQTFHNFAGRDPSPAALLRQLGIAEQASEKKPEPPVPGGPA